MTDWELRCLGLFLSLLVLAAGLSIRAIVHRLRNRTYPSAYLLSRGGEFTGIALQLLFGLVCAYFALRLAITT